MSSPNFYIQNITSYVEEHMSFGAISLDDLCAHVNLSRSQIHRIVKSETGLSTTIYIRKIRIEAAKELLKKSALNISEISYKVGIDNPQNFSKYFKQFEKVSPTEFREAQSSISPSNASSINTRKTRTIFTVIGSVILVVMLVSLAYWYWGTTPKVITAPDVNKVLAVLPFENKTSDPNNDILGFMAMDWISSGLLTNRSTKVIKVDNIALQDADPEYYKSRGAEIFIKGRYYSLNDNEVTLICDLVDAETGQILFTLPEVKGDLENPIPMLKNVQQRILGYYEVGDSYQGNHVPRYDAYKLYVEALTEPLEYPYLDNIAKLKRSIALDSSFIDPYFRIFYVGHWRAIVSERDAAIQYLEQHKASMSDFQKLYFQAITFTLNGDPKNSGLTYHQLYKKYGDILYAQRTSSSLRFANYLNAAVEVYEDFSGAYKKPNTNSTYGHYINALYELREFEKIKSVMKTNLGPPTDILAPMAYLRILIRENKLDEYNTELDYYLSQPLTYLGYNAKSALMYAQLQEMSRLNRTEWLVKYLPKFFEIINSEDQYLFKNGALAYYYFMSEDYEKAYEFGVKVWEEDGIAIFGELAGLALYKMGRMEELNTYIETVRNRPSRDFPGAISYTLGVMTSYLDKETALAYLQKSVDEGFEFDYYCYRNDNLLAPLLEDPSFISLTEPKQLSESERNSLFPKSE